MVSGERTLTYVIAVVCVGALILLSLHVPKYYIRSDDVRGSVVVTQTSERCPSRAELKTVDWIKVLGHIPYNIERCQELSKNKTMDPQFEADFGKFLDEVARNGPTMGNLGQEMYREVFIYLQELIKAPFIKTVCETGFNAGHSSFGWLRSNPDVQVYSFDIGTNKYSRPMAAYLERTFPGRHHITWGDSTKTLPEFRRRNPDFRCDFILIDGGHYYNVVRSDFTNFRAMANTVHILMMDNYPDARFMWMGDMWEYSKRKSELVEFFQCTYGDRDPEGISIGRYNI